MYIEALKFAYDKHKGQKREDGESYITHPIEVSLKYLPVYYNWKTRIVAILHDTLEDTDTTMPELERKFGEEIMNSVSLLSNRKTEPYEEYIRRIKVCGDKEDIAVKIADLKHNLSTIDNIKDESRRKKLKDRYEKALKVLE